MVLKVAIVGGGIGGLTTALCIDRLCGDNVTLEVFEQAPQYKVYLGSIFVDSRKLVQVLVSDLTRAELWT
jgi:2-polyprenyl-6-methoxyphenol hydroxylase-like FAD-dependent oxidoreductase